MSTILKIDIDKIGIIRNMDLSDSADSLFKAEFLTKKKSLDIISLKKYIKKKRLKSISLLMQISIYFDDTKVIHTKILTQLMQFNNVPFNGLSIILKPIDEGFVRKSEN